MGAKAPKGRGRKRKSAAIIEADETVDSDEAMTGLESPRDNDIKPKKSGKGVSRKKKIKDVNSDEEMMKNFKDETPPEPKKRKRKQKKEKEMIRTPTISAQNSVHNSNSENESDTDNGSTISKLSKLSRVDSYTSKLDC